MTFTNTASISPTNTNPSLIPQPIPYLSMTMPAPATTDRPLLACATISHPDQNNPANRGAYSYININGGWAKPHRTSHLDGRLPRGGNIGMLDGHVEWRKFPKMLPRTNQGSGSPVFWW
jgi:prepilin-type processing-associated H-X9-DG protein